MICSFFLNAPFPGHTARYYSPPARCLVPTPLQKPHPPIWVAATSPATFEAAARMGLGVLAFTAVSPDEIEAAVRAYRAAQGEARPIGGYANPQVAAFAVCYVDEDDRRGRDVACAAARWYLGDNNAELQQLRFTTLTGANDRLDRIKQSSDDELIEQGIVLGGNPDTVCRQIERWANIGLDQLMLMIQAGYTGHDQILRSQELLGTHVIPKFESPADPILAPAPAGSAGPNP